MKKKQKKEKHPYKNLEYSHIYKNIRTKTIKSLKPILMADDKFMSNVFRHSTKPKNTYCDITGLPTQYCDPNTKNYYFNKDIYELMKEKKLAYALRWQELKNVYKEFYPFF